MTAVHPTAIVSPRAELGEGVTIGPYCIVADHVKIGDGTVLASFVTILDFTEIGPGCRITQNAVIGGEPQDLSFRGEESWVRILSGRTSQSTGALAKVRLPWWETAASSWRGYISDITSSSAGM